ncbi:MAG: TIR domain-containing protein [Chloroflexi bacterium]|nr:TIR domain-containing protein [Chloroflexota bacterium]
MSDVFISYSRNDQVFVRKLHNSLAVLNRDTWVDSENIPLTAEWLKEIHAGIESAQTFVFIISPDSVASKTCGEEIAHAVRNNKRIVPVMHRDVPDFDVPQPLRPINWIFFRKNDDFDAKFQELLQSLDTDLEWVRAHTRLLTRSIEWNNRMRNDSFVLRGADLRAAEEWLSQSAIGKETKPTPLQSEYILASRQSATRQQRTLLTGVTIALVVAIALALAAVFQWNSANVSEAKAINNAATAVAESQVRATAEAQALDRSRVATSRELAASSISNLNSDPQLAALLAIQADQTAHTYESEDALRQTIRTLPLALRGHTSAVNRAGWSPDGKQIVTASNDATARIWDAASGRELTTLRGHAGSVYSAVWSPDGKQIVTTGADTTARIHLTRIEDLVALARTRVTRDLTCAEREKYLHEPPCPTPTPTLTPTTQPTRTPAR